jgi:hypothetical protein
MRAPNPWALTAARGLPGREMAYCALLISLSVSETCLGCRPLPGHALAARPCLSRRSKGAASCAAELDGYSRLGYLATRYHIDYHNDSACSVSVLLRLAYGRLTAPNSVGGHV